MQDSTKGLDGLSPEKRQVLAHLLKQKGLIASLPPITRRGKPIGIPLSFAQEQLWYLHELYPHSPAYTMVSAYCLLGPLNLSCLERSLREIICRHEILRTTFAIKEDNVVQIIHMSYALHLPILDLTGLQDGGMQEAVVQRLIHQEAQNTFQLSTGPLIHVTTLKLHVEKHIFLLSFHHMISDGWSIGVFVREFSLLYNAFSHGLTSPLVALPVQYGDFALWQHEVLQGATYAMQVAYWKKHLSGMPALLELPVDRPRPPMPTFRGEVQSWVLPEALSAGLKLLSRKCRMTLFMTLLAGLALLLHLYTGQNDLAIGTTLANRNQSDLENLIGLFADIIILRMDLTNDPTMLTFLERVREVALAAYEHHDVPFGHIVKTLQPERNLSYSPLFQVTFGFQNRENPHFRLVDLTVESLPVNSKVAKFDLSLDMSETTEGLRGAWLYNTDLFNPSTISRMTRHFQRLLEQMIEAPSKRLSEFTLLTREERQRIVIDWNATQVNYPRAFCIHEIFEAQALRRPDAIAVVYEEQQLTYQELNQCARQLGHVLRKLGVGPEMLVGVCMERSCEMIIALLAILKAGGAYVPLDPGYPKERLAFLVADAQLSLLLTQRRLVSLLPEQTAQRLYLDEDWHSEIANRSAPPEQPVTPSNLAYVIYTSGTTGKPKGVMISHAGVVSLAIAQARIFGMQPGDRILQFASLNFDASIWEIVMALAAGATLCLVAQETQLSGSAFLDLLQKERITSATLTPSVLEVLPASDLPALQTLIAAGEACPAELVKKWGSERRFFNAYGPTETTVCASAALCQPDGMRPSIGKPIANMQMYILDSSWRLLPVGVPGELYIGGAGIARGYLRNPSLTAERLLPHPFSSEPGMRLYKTGDLARYLADGSLEFVGRNDHQVKIRGHRIELREIEAVLEMHPAIREAIVLVREEKQADRCLVAFVVPQQDQRPSMEELRVFLQERLPNYMLPATLLTLDVLPLTPHGKLDHLALLAQSHLPLQTQHTFVSPRDTIERQLTQVWEELLATRPVGIRDNFFVCGGHSLLALRLLNTIQKLFQQQLELSFLLQNATIEAIAQRIRQGYSYQPPSPLVSIHPFGTRRALFCVHAGSGNPIRFYNLARYLGEDQPLYGLQDPDIYEKDFPHRTIEAIATRYIDAIRAIQPHGPYFLCGYSFGSIVAFEMARQLQQQEQVAFLGLLDGAAPDSFAEVETDDAHLLAILAVELMRFSSKNTLKQWYDNIVHLDFDEKMHYIIDQIKMAKIELLGDPWQWLSRNLRIFRTRIHSTQEYRGQRYAGKITFFRSSESDKFGTNEKDDLVKDIIDLGWSSFSTQPIEIHMLPGYHENMLSEPQIRVVAEIVRSCLDKVQQSIQDTIGGQGDVT